MAAHKRQLITFDWALKRVLRSKANHKVLEGFLSELLGEDVVITEILESESNRESALDRGNRVDLLVRDSRNRQVLIEVQYAREGDYFHRMAYGAAKVITESLSAGQRYGEIARLISVNIVYFDIGHGEDYVYAGKTEFRGLHGHDLLELNREQRQLFTAESVADLFPQYYILKVKNFNAVAKTGLDEWIQFLKTGEIGAKCQARGLREAKNVLDLLKLSDAERRAYEAYIKEQRIAAGVAESTILSLDRAERERDAAWRQADDARRQAEEARRQTEDAQHQAEDARRQAEMAQRQISEERRQKEQLAAQLAAQLEAAVAALVAKGMSEDEARRLLA